VVGEKAYSGSQSSAYCFLIDEKAYGGSQSLAYCFVVDERAYGGTQISAYCFVVEEKAYGSTQSSAYCFVVDERLQLYTGFWFYTNFSLFLQIRRIIYNVMLSCCTYCMHKKGVLPFMFYALDC
jgi:hypothetical protein